MSTTAAAAASAAKYEAPDKTSVPVKRSRPPTTSKKTIKIKRLNAWQLFHVFHRLLVLAAALWYTGSCLQAFSISTTLLPGRILPFTEAAADHAHLIGQFVGTTTIRESPLVVEALHNQTTTSSDETLYLHESHSTSFDMCGTLATDQQRQIYSNSFLRAMFKAIVRDASYNLTFLNDLSLVAPVVDCTADVLAHDPSQLRVYFLVYNKTNHQDMAILAMRASNQEYKVSASNEEGPALMVVITLIKDMAVSQVHHDYLVASRYPVDPLKFLVYDFVSVTEKGYWSLKSRPVATASSSTTEISKTLTTNRRSGFVVFTRTEQSNLNMLVWQMEPTPLETLTRFRWRVLAMMYDTWAWTHIFHLLLSIDLLYNVGILVLLLVRNLWHGKLWVGDAFMAISKTLLLRGAFVLCSWQINGYWPLFESVYSDAYRVTGELESVRFFRVVILCDLLTIYLSICDLLGRFLKERIDPAFAVGCFLLGDLNRHAMLTWSAPLLASVQGYARHNFNRAFMVPVHGQNLVTPMQCFASHVLVDKPFALVLQVLLPTYCTLVLVVIYIALRKWYRRKHPTRDHTSKATGTANSQEEAQSLKLKGTHTNFELATGAQMENRFGVLSDYENYWFVKGMKYASADGIYSNGFVISNGKFVVEVETLWIILVMKLLRMRFRTVYVFEIDGTTVKQTARIVYPETFTWRDLVLLNLTVLS